MTIMKAKLIVLVFTFILAVSCGKNQSEEYTVKKGPFKQSFTETGELEAVSAAALVMPRISYQFGYEFKIVRLAEHGKMVKEGDSIIYIDPSSIQKFIISKEEALQNERASSNKQLVQMENNIQEVKAQLRSEQATYDLKKLELEPSKFESENKRKIKELEFKQATIRLNKVKRQLEKKPILDNYDYKVQKIKVMQGEAELSSAKEILNRMVITSPKDGLFQVANSMFEWPPRMIKVGDRVYTGMLIARIPDIFHMKIRTFVNEADITKISMGMKVMVRLDALPTVPFHGMIKEISRVCLPREKEKVFNVVVNIEESDLRLKPGMTVSCEYLCMEVENALYVPNSCLLKEDGKYFIFLKKGTSNRKTEVRVGPSNSNHTLIYGEVVPGQPLVPFEQVLDKKNS
ncbi:MAG: HlyD family efflux transporter periplasmic adaptor subunit [Porphyromonadaceae bacterium]|nr:MAG: HlyD family efflux transporter periplasmic adaptor subunit [Porphyromonadaceae bacterium]